MTEPPTHAALQADEGNDPVIPAVSWEIAYSGDVALLVLTGGTGEAVSVPLQGTLTEALQAVLDSQYPELDELNAQLSAIDAGALDIEDEDEPAKRSWLAQTGLGTGRLATGSGVDRWLSGLSGRSLAIVVGGIMLVLLIVYVISQLGR